MIDCVQIAAVELKGNSHIQCEPHSDRLRVNEHLYYYPHLLIARLW